MPAKVWVDEEYIQNSSNSCKNDNGSYNNWTLINLPQVSTSVSGSTDSGEVSVDLKNFNEHIQFSTEFGQKQPGFHVGLEIGDDHKVVKGNTPEPTSLKLKPILDVFDPRFWVRLPENENTTPQIERKKWLLKWALLVYPLKLEATIGQGRWMKNRAMVHNMFGVTLTNPPRLML